MICPKCHQPLEGEEQYICCAGATLQWRCRECAKLSEGFAFPYGGCPHCGGKLEPVASRQLEGEDALQAIRAAFEIEMGGRAFYTRAAEEKSGLRELFRSLAAMEEEHMQTLARRYHAQAPTASAEMAVERAALFAGIDHRPGDPGNLLRIAIACEQRAAHYLPGATLPVRRCRCDHLTTLATLTPNTFAAARVEQPCATNPTTRVRRSMEYGRAIHAGLLLQPAP